jgi:hypothetical protein
MSETYTSNGSKGTIIRVNSSDAPVNDEMTDAQAKDASEALKGGTWNVTGDGQIDHRESISVNTGLAESPLKGNVMSSVRTRTGRPVANASEIDPKTCTVEVQGVRSDIQSMMAAGLIARDSATGLYYDVNGPSPSDPRYQETIEKESKPTEVKEVNFKTDHFSREIQNLKAHSSGGSAAVDAGIDRVLTGVANDDPDRASQGLSDLEQLTGGNPAQIENMLNEMIDTSIHRAAKFHTISTGESVDIDTVTDLVFDKCSPQKRQQFLRSIYYNDLRTFSAIISDLKLGNFR